MGKVRHTRIAGVTMEAGRQDCLKFLQRVMRIPEHEDIQLRLKPEPDNPHDPDAIAVLFEWKAGEFFKLGYIPNHQTMCKECGEVMERHPQSGSCPSCSRKGHLVRYGTASQLKTLFDDPPVDAWLEEITGGEDGKSYGANIGIAYGE